MGLGLRYDNLHLIILMDMVTGIIYHIDPKLRKVYMDQRTLLLIMSILGGENQ